MVMSSSDAQALSDLIETLRSSLQGGVLKCQLWINADENLATDLNGAQITEMASK